MADAGTPGRAKLSPAAETDIRDALLWSQEHFGAAAAERYASLIRQAIRDIGSDPLRPGSRVRTELPGGVRTYHLYFSRARVPRESRPVR